MPYSPEVQLLVGQFWQRAYGRLTAGEVCQLAIEMLDERRAAEALDLVAANAPFALTECRLLEVGAGVGAVVAVARERGVHAFGIEPSWEGTVAARQLLGERGIDPVVACAVGETLPFADAVFDVVCSFQVLEHTRQPEVVLAEAFRVLKPGGCFVHVFPNYGSFWEGHYGVPWLPHLPRALARGYIRLLRRDPGVLEELQLLTHGQVARMLHRYPDVEVVDWGIDLWEHRVRTLDFSEWAHLGRLKRMVRWVHRLRLVDLLVALGRALHFETPIVLAGRKRPGVSHGPTDGAGASRLRMGG